MKPQSAFPAISGVLALVILTACGQQLETAASSTNDVEVLQAVDEGTDVRQQLVVIRDGLPDGVALRLMRGIATGPAWVALPWQRNRSRSNGDECGPLPG